MDRLGLLPFFKICIFWCNGILIYRLTPSIPSWVTFSITALFFTLLSIFVFGKIHLLPSKKWILPLFAGLLFSSLSFNILSFTSPLKNKSHVLNCSFKAVHLEVTRSLSQSKSIYKTEAKVLSVLNDKTWQPADGNVLIYFLDSISPKIEIGYQLLVENHKVARISEPGNPEQFNYANYMANKGTFHQAFLRPDEYSLVSTQEKKTLTGFFEKARENLLNKLAYLSTKTKPVAEALLLGYKENLNEDVRSIFAKTGTMHILAVSGLHVGIIYKAIDWCLMFLLGVRYGKPLKTSLVLLCLWSYAFLTGMPPSVLRACIMFSFIALGSSLNRPNNIFNNVLASAFFLLVIKPNLLFDVSFQLSYAAVFGIIGFQPYLAQFFKPKNGVIKFFWDLITVSFAAQIATLPFTLYYFNQVPLIFPISNLIAIPGAFLVVGFGAALLFSNLIGGAFQSVIESIYQSILDLLVGAIDFLSAIPFANIDHIVINLTSAIFLFLIVLTLPYAIRFKNKKWLITFLLIMCFWTSAELFRNNNEPKAEFVVFQTKGQSVYGYKTASKAHFILTDSLKRDVGFETEGWYKRFKRVDTLHISSNIIRNKELYLTQNLLHFNKTLFAINTYTADERIDYYLFSNQDIFSNSINLSPDKCIFDASVKPDWVLKNNPTFAAAHFVQRDGAFVKEIP